MGSIWSESINMESREILNGEMSVDTAVIGGGMAGVLISYFLIKDGQDTVVLEASGIGSGQTKNTTAKITSQHGLIYSRLERYFGKELTRQYAFANEMAIRKYGEIIEEKKIECDFEYLPSYLYSNVDSDSLEEECKSVLKAGIKSASLIDETILPFPVRKALRFADQAQFNPLKFLKAISNEVRIFEKTRAISIEDGKIKTNGGTVKAKNIVFACHYPFINVPGYYFMRMHQERSYVIALENAFKPDGMYYGIDNDGLSFRRYGDLLLMGGENHRTGENTCGDRYNNLRKTASELFPMSRETAHWSAQDCIPIDGVPYIGKFSSSEPNWYVATGFQKWGMTSSMVSAMIISELITDGKCEFSEVFSPQRFKLSPSAKNVITDGVQSVKGLARRILEVPEDKHEGILRGHGGIVELDGHKTGIYKDFDGKIFAVSVKCPHLGCQLEWNPDELSWDCPCHGSRFDYKGNLLDGPAQTPIT